MPWQLLGVHSVSVTALASTLPRWPPWETALNGPPALHTIPEIGWSDAHRYSADNGHTEKNSDIHTKFREAHEGHKAHAGLDPSRASTGVVWTSERAYEHGFLDHPEEWANLGQGAPEVEDGKPSP